MGICDELRNNAGLGDYLAIVGKTGDQAALLGLVFCRYVFGHVGCGIGRCPGVLLFTYWVDFKVPRLSGLAQINCDFFIVKARFLEGNVCTVCPGAEAAGV